jgi:hypothetical protein
MSLKNACTLPPTDAGTVPAEGDADARRPDVLESESRAIRLDREDAVGGW